MEKEVQPAGTHTEVQDDPMRGFVEFTKQRFKLLNKLIYRDLNNYRNLPAFRKYTKDDITNYLVDPYKYQGNLLDAVIYIYGASSHFRRLIQYFTALSDLSYVVSPFGIDPKKANKKTVNGNYRKVLNTLNMMSIKTQFPKILTVCLREDTFFGTIWQTKDSITIQQLPSKYCMISSIEGNVFNVTFNFSYFNTRPELLGFYPEEFRRKYELYRNKNNKVGKWIELDSPTSFAIKCNNDIPDYSLPPFAGILREIYDIEDYKTLKLTKTAIENYAMLAMTIPTNDEGEWLIDEKKAEEFWSNLDDVLPEEIGSILTPMPVQKISFEKSNTGDTNTISDAEQNLFTAAGVSSLLFNNSRASANALLLSIKADQALTFGIVKSIEDMLNRFIQSLSYGKNFKVTFLDVSPFNRKEVGDEYLKACQYGMPMISYYCATFGLSQSEIDTMSYLEGEVLELQKLFKPLISSTQLSAEAINDVDNQGGRPEVDDEDLTDSGEQTREDRDDWG